MDVGGGVTVAVGVPRVCSMIAITFGATVMRGDMTVRTALAILASNYAYKLVAAAADTLPFYWSVGWLSRWLQIDPMKEHRGLAEETEIAG